MPSWLDVKTRIGAVENIKKITRAMQLVAAAKFNRAQPRARSARPYSRELDAILSALASSSSDDGGGETTLQFSLVEDGKPIEVDFSRLFAEAEVERPGVVLVTSDRGLCGSFNTRLIRTASDFMSKHSAMDCRLITIGKKGRAFFKRTQKPIIMHEEGLSDRLELDDIRRITDRLVRLFVDGEVDALYLIYTQFRSAMTSDVTVEKFLSIPPVEKQESEMLYILEPDRAAVYETLIPLYMKTKIFATLADSFASEYGARMTAMQLATKNAEELYDDLVILRNRLRQALITKELAEIVGGAEGLR